MLVDLDGIVDSSPEYDIDRFRLYIEDLLLSDNDLLHRTDGLGESLLFKFADQLMFKEAMALLDLGASSLHKVSGHRSIIGRLVDIQDDDEAKNLLMKLIEHGYSLTDHECLLSCLVSGDIEKSLSIIETNPDILRDDAPRLGPWTYAIAFLRAPIRAFSLITEMGVSLSSTTQHSDGRTALFCSAYCPSVTKKLIESGIDVDHRDRRNLTALHCVCGPYTNMEAATMIIDCSRDTSPIDDFGGTPLDYARDYRDIYRIMRERGALHGREMWNRRVN